jgi:hypothetical protein
MLDQGMSDDIEECTSSLWNALVSIHSSIYYAGVLVFFACSVFFHVGFAAGYFCRIVIRVGGTALWSISIGGAKKIHLPTATWLENFGRSTKDAICGAMDRFTDSISLKLLLALASLSRLKFRVESEARSMQRFVLTGK